MMTPSDSPSAPGPYASVPVSGTDIQAGNDEAAVSAAFDAANAANGQGVLYPVSARQDQAKALIQSDAGFAIGGYDIDAGSAFGWPADVKPGG